MKTSRFLAAAAGATLLASLVAAPTASAETTDVTFTVSGGGLAIAYKSVDSVSTESGDLSDPTFSLTGTTSTGSLGTLVVTDNRAAVGSWKVTASMTGPFQAKKLVNAAWVDADLDNDGSTTDDVIPCTAAKFTTGTPTVSPLGSATVTNAAVAGLSLSDLDADGNCQGTATVNSVEVSEATDIVTATVIGSNSVEFTSTLTVTIPNTALAGTYMGTVSQTVA